MLKIKKKGEKSPGKTLNCFFPCALVISSNDLCALNKGLAWANDLRQTNSSQLVTNPQEMHPALIAAA